MIWWYPITHLLIHTHTHTLYSMFGQMEWTEKKSAQTKADCAQYIYASHIYEWTCIHNINTHIAFWQIHTMQRGRWERLSRSLSTYCSLSLCHRSHISGIQVKQKDYSLVFVQAMMMDDSTKNVLIITLTSHAWFSACRWTPSDPSCCSSLCPSWLHYHSLQVDTQKDRKRWVNHEVDKQYFT